MYYDNKKGWGVCTPNDHYLRAPISQASLTAENYEIKLNLLNLIQHNQFGGSASQDASMLLNTFFELCDMMRLKDVETSAVNLHLFPFSLRWKAKEWFL